VPLKRGSAGAQSGLVALKRLYKPRRDPDKTVSLRRLTNEIGARHEIYLKS